MKFLIKKRNLRSIIALLFYKIALDIVYFFFISDIWGYMGFELNLSILKLIESFLLFIPILIFIPKSKKKLSNIIIWILVLLAYLPMLTLYGFGNRPRIFMYAVTLFWLFIFLAKCISFKQFAVSYLTHLKRGKKAYKLVALFILILTGIILFKFFEPSIKLNFKNIYQIRSQYKTNLAMGGGYLFNWTAKIIIPFLTALFVIKRKWLYLLPLFLFQILLFSVTGHKTYFFLPFFVLGLMWTIQRKNPLTWMAMGLILVILAGIGIYWTTGNIIAMSYFTRRTMFTSSQLSFQYYEFFSEHQFTHLAHHRIFRNFLEYPYELGPADLIGEIYYDGSHANNGIMSNGYMNFGFIGMGLWAIFYTILFKIIDTLSFKKNEQIAIGAIAAISLTLMNTSLLTNFLTNGLFLFLFLLYLLPPNNNYAK